MCGLFPLLHFLPFVLHYAVLVITTLFVYLYLSEWSAEVADIAIRYKDRGEASVVGVDIAGDELAPMDDRHIEAFKVPFLPM